MKYKKMNSSNWSRQVFFSIFFLVFTCQLFAQQYNLPQQEDRWKILSDGSIEWLIDKRLPHNDHIEMSGEKVSMWVQYGVDTSGKASLVRTMVFPSYRLLPQRT